MGPLAAVYGLHFEVCATAHDPEPNYRAIINREAPLNVWKVASSTRPSFIAPDSGLPASSGVRSRRMVTYNLPPEPVWRQTVSALSARLPRTWTQRLREPRTRVAALLFAAIMAGACAVLFAAAARLAFSASGH